MTSDAEILKALDEIFADVLEEEDVRLTPQTTAKDVDGWDSLNHIRLMIEVQRHYGIKFSTTEIAGLKNVGDLIALVQKRTQQK